MTNKEFVEIIKKNISDENIPLCHGVKCITDNCPVYKKCIEDEELSTDTMIKILKEYVNFYKNLERW